MEIFCFSPFGYEGALVKVEVDLRRGIPAVDIVGLADSAIKESRERMRSAILNSGLDFPPERVLINLSPADIKKEGAGFDLAIALAVLCAKDSSDRKILVMGELELNGTIRPVKSVHAAVSTALEKGITQCIVADENAREAREPWGTRRMKVMGAANLIQAARQIPCEDFFMEKDESQEEHCLYPENSICIEGIWFPPVTEESDFKFVRGQAKLVRGLQIAAAGGHNLMAYGPPGCGKTLSLSKYPSLLPYLTGQQSQAVTRIHSVAGLLPPSGAIIRPQVRMPHQTASVEGMCGGGPKCMPGEISLAHKGVLFLDEAAEFRSTVLQMLRVPMETGSITLSRAGRSSVFPADFQLLMSTNPCPCGNYGSPDKICLCSAHAVDLYWRKFSGPLLDRVDIRIRVDCVPSEESSSASASSNSSSSLLRIQVAKARAMQKKRQDKLNAKLTASEVMDFCTMTKEAEELLLAAASQFDMSQRAEAGCTKLARTISDMKEESIISAKSMEEAVELRKPSGDGCGLI